MLNREGDIECYIRQTNQLPDSYTIQSYCIITGEKRLTIYFNSQVNAGTAFYLDILHVTQPLASNFIHPPTNIWIGIDSNVYDNVALNAQQYVNIDTAPSTAAVAYMTITSVVVSSNYIRNNITLSITINLPSSTVVNN